MIEHPTVYRWSACAFLLLALAGHAQAPEAKNQTLREREANPARNAGGSTMVWPHGAKMALSLTFDDGRDSQVDVGLPLLDSFGVKATFYPLPEAVGERLEGWKAAVAAGHEIGNHTVGHPCTGNFSWTRYDGVVLEDYDLQRMRREIVDANDQLKAALGVRPASFAYPCGQTFVGRGAEVRSYVPLVAELFQTGRRWLDETTNAPEHFDPAQIMSMRMDGEGFGNIQRRIEYTKRSGNWLVLAGHEVREPDHERRGGTSALMLRELLTYAADPANGVWVAPVAEVAIYIQQHLPSARSH